MSDDTEESRAGTQFGPYRLIRLLGRGGMGVVYEAEDTVRDRRVALKLMSKAYSQDPVFRKRMQREARTAGRLQEPHVVPIHDYGEIDGQLFVDMRLIEGTDLGTMLSRFGPMGPARAVVLISQIASALHAAHNAGVMHRDVKPANILVTKDDFAYLVDFGIANAAEDEKLTQMGSTIGTWIYMAPERFLNEDVSNRSDTYSLACVLYESLTGFPPYRAKGGPGLMTAHLNDPIPKPSEARPGIPGTLDEVIARGMAKDPADRYSTASDLAMAAHEALSEPDQDRASDILRRSQVATLPHPPQATDRLPPVQRHTTPPPRTTNPPRTEPPPAYAGGIPSSGPMPRTTPPQAAQNWSSQQPWQSQPQTLWGSQPHQAAPQQFWGQQMAGPPPRNNSKLWLGMAGAAALVVVIVVVVGIVFWPKPTPKPPANQVKLQVIADGVSVGAPNAPTTIDIFNEPICPQCGEFIRTYGSEMQTAINDKKIIVHYHLLNFLDPDSASRDYSTRALAASLCVAAANDPKVYTDYYGALFSSNFQPKEGGTSDPSDTELAQLAESTGTSSEVTDCITSGKNITEAGAKATTAYQTLHRLMPAPATPAVYNGTQKVDTSDSSWLSRLS